MACSECYEVHGAIVAPLDSYDWKEVFKYAEPQACGHGGTFGPFTGELQEPFSRETVAEVLALAEGDNDGPDWIALLRLSDGRFACIRAGCDYSGWG